MQALKQEVYITDNHRLNIDVPDDVPTGPTEIILIFQSLNKSKCEKKRILGAAKGRIKVSPDFDNPLPDDILNSFYL